MDEVCPLRALLPLRACPVLWRPLVWFGHCGTDTPLGDRLQVGAEAGVRDRVDLDAGNRAGKAGNRGNPAREEGRLIAVRRGCRCN